MTLTGAVAGREKYFTITARSFFGSYVPLSKRKYNIPKKWSLRTSWYATQQVERSVGLGLTSYHGLICTFRWSLDLRNNWREDPEISSQIRLSVLPLKFTSIVRRVGLTRSTKLFGCMGRMMYADLCAEGEVELSDTARSLRRQR